MFSDWKSYYSITYQSPVSAEGFREAASSTTHREAAPPPLTPAYTNFPSPPTGPGAGGVRQLQGQHGQSLPDQRGLDHPILG
jgi:hypothetical protein